MFFFAFKRDLVSEYIFCLCFIYSYDCAFIKCICTEHENDIIT